MENWKKEIYIALLVKQKLAEVDAAGLWPFHYPELPASEDQLREMENAMGFRLDPLYRNYLSFSNGWKGFIQKDDLFGTTELIGNEKSQRANSFLTSIDNMIEMTGFQNEELLAIACSQEDIDVFVMTKPFSHKPGIALWLAGGLIDTFPNFDEFFLAMVDYNRREVQRFQGQL